MNTITVRKDAGMIKALVLCMWGHSAEGLETMQSRKVLQYTVNLGGLIAMYAAPGGTRARKGRQL